MFGEQQDRQEAVGWMKLIADAGAAAVFPLTRTRIGIEGIGMPGARALVLILLWAGATGSEPLLMLYLPLWLIACAWQRMKTMRLVRQGWVEHSRYTGWPWLVMKLNPLLRNERGAKMLWEPILWLVVAVLVGQVHEGTGWFFAFCAACLTLSTGIDTQIDQMRLRRMRDAQIEQQQMAEWYQSGGL